MAHRQNQHVMMYAFIATSSIYGPLRKANVYCNKCERTVLTSDLIYHCNKFNCQYDICELCVIKAEQLFTKCPQFINLTNVMKLYNQQFVDGISNHYIQNINISSVLNDFLYTLHHYSDSDESFEIIASELGCCDATKCKIFSRNYRNRNNQQTKTLYTVLDNDNDICSTQILDKIHCFYQHCFDIGNRLSLQDKKKCAEVCNSDYKNDIDDAVDSSLTCKNILEIAKIIRSKRACYNNLTAVNPKYSQLFNQLQTVQANTNNTNNNKHFYQFGVKFSYTAGYYYDYDGIRRYSTKRHSTLKQEVTSNHIASLTMQQWITETKKAAIHLNSDYCKQYYPELQNDQIFSLMIYCNFTAFQTILSRTYRETPREHSVNFWHLGKNLKEMVHRFGTEMSETAVLYHGVGEKLLFNKVIGSNATGVQILCPLSTSSELSVALNFSNNNNGLILQFESGRYFKPKYFACAWLSDFGNECEHLFIQNKGFLRIINIMDTQFGYEYAKILKCLRYIECITGQSDFCQQLTETEVCLMIKMAKHQLSNERKEFESFDGLNSYAKRLMDTYFENKICVELTIKKIVGSCGNNLFWEIFCGTDLKRFDINLLKIIFPKCKVVVIYGADILLCESIIDDCVNHLPLSAVERIWFKNGNNDKQLSDLCEKYKDRLKNIGFLIFMEGNNCLTIEIDVRLTE